MRCALPYLSVLSAILACGPGDPAGSATDTGTSTGPSTTTGATTTPSTTTGEPTGTSTPPVTTTDATTTDATTTDATTTGTTTGTTTDATTTDATTGGSTTGGGAVELRARYFPGGLDRIVVRKADVDAGLCTSIIFVWPGDPPAGLVLPAMWGLQSAEIGDDLATCLDLMSPFLANPVPADAVTGSAAWNSPGCPPTIAVDLTLDFSPAEPWVPAQDVVQAAAIPLDGC